MIKENNYEQIPFGHYPIKLMQFDTADDLFPLHWHEHLEILYVTHGILNVRCGEDILSVNNGECIIFNRNVLHQALPSSALYNCIMISPFFFDNTLYTFNNLISDSYISKLFDDIFEAEKQKDSLTVKGLTYLLLSYLSQNFIEKDLSANVTYNAIQDIVNYLSGNFTSNITTSQLAKKAHMSESYFCRMFKECTGDTVKSYLNCLRLNKALSLLKSTNMPITDIALECGFSDLNYFTRVFTKYIGHAPNTYRKKNK